MEAEDPCTNPQLWYSPESDDQVHWGCEAPAPGWRREPYLGDFGVDLDGALRGGRDVFAGPTGDTGPRIPLLPPAQDFGPPPTGDTGFAFDDTAFPEGPTGGDTGVRGPDDDPNADTDTVEQGDTGATADTGYLETGDTAPTGDTGFAPPPEPTADTGEPPADTDSPAPPFGRPMNPGQP